MRPVGAVPSSSSARPPTKLYAVAGGAAGAAASAAASAPCWRRRVAPRARVIPHAVALDIGTELWVEEFTIDGVGSISANVYEGDDAYTILIHMDGMPASTRMHWSVDDWVLPPRDCWPDGTDQIDDMAVQTSFGQNPITITMKKEGAPSRLVFVLKVTEPKEKWHNNGSQFNINVRAPCASDIFGKALEAEEHRDTYTLMGRFQLAMELLGQAEKVPGGDAMGFIYTWLRLSSLKLLDWYRNGNYQPKDMGHVQKTLVEMLANVARSAEDPTVRHFARLTASGMSRGGGDSEQIRLEILNILRRNGIREGHRPGIECHFLEAWHQKLHSNTTVEDIAIAEAYIHFLGSDGDPGGFWWHLWEYGGISRERAASMKCGWKSDGIKADPLHLPHMINDMKHYLWILKTVHAGSNMKDMVVMAQGDLDDELKGMLWDLVNNQGEWWAAGKALECRQRLEGYWRAGTGGRDVFLLDTVLEKFVRMHCEGQNLDAMDRDSQVAMVELLLKNGCIAAESTDMGNTLASWQKMMGGDMWSKEGAMTTCAVIDRAQVSLSYFMDHLYERIQPHARAIGKVATVNGVKGIDDMYILNFAEESIRGHPLYYLSPILQKLQMQARECAGLSPWQTVSNVEEGVTGVVKVANLEDIQGEKMATPTLLISDQVGGLEDIPQGVVAVVVDGGMDVLSHVAIRARNQNVLCVACANSAEVDELRAMDGQTMSFTIAADGSIDAVAGELSEAPAAAPVNAAPVAEEVKAPAPVEEVKAEAEVPAPVEELKAEAEAPENLEQAAPAVAPAAVAPVEASKEDLKAEVKAQLAAQVAKAKGEPAPEASKPIALKTRTDSGLWAVADTAFTSELVGGKGLHLSELRAALPAGVAVPASAALPFGSYERCVAAPANLVAEATVEAGLEEAFAAEDAVTVRVALEIVRGAVMSMVPADGLEAAVVAAAAEAGLRGLQWDTAWNGIKTVWASQWNERAWLSRRALGLEESHLQMACVLQNVVSAKYAFVLHTANPLTGNKDEMLGEVVLGLGETLVSNTPGRAFSFKCERDGSNLQIMSAPSKRTALYSPSADAIIARSDSNAEDLEGFAGAGLYDSVIVGTDEGAMSVELDYADEPLLWDKGFQTSLVNQLAAVGVAIETAFGGQPQDIEGALDAEGNLWVVQARPEIL